MGDRHGSSAPVRRDGRSALIGVAGLYERLGLPSSRFQRAPIAIAHRGASAYALDNTEAAFRKAAALGADMWEIDVQLSADGVCIISHDDDLLVTAGVATNISALSSQGLQAISLNNGGRLLTLDHMIDLATELNAGLYIEIKAKKAGPLVWQQLLARGFDRAVIGSFDGAVISELRQAGCAYPLSILVRAGADPFRAAGESDADIIHLCWLEAADQPQTLITEKLLQEAAERDLPIITWHEERRSVLDALAAMPIFGICSNRPETIKPYRPSDAHPIALVCHRGANHVAPENTLAAARICFGQGFDYVEIDVRTTADGMLVVIHDDIVNRTTDGSGYVAEMTLQDLRALDAGSWFELNFTGETIPTLAEMLMLARTYSRGLYIELKVAEPADVLEEVRTEGMLEQCFFGSEMPDVMRRLRRLGPDARLMARRCDFASLEAAIADTAPEIIEFDPKQDDLTEMTRCREHGIKTMIYDQTHDLARLTELSLLQPDYLNLDRPDLFKQVVDDVTSIAT